MTVVELSVFEAEKAVARREGRCMACNKPTKVFGRSRDPEFKGRRKSAVLCWERDCFRYYLALYHAAHRARRAGRRAARKPQLQEQRA